MTSTSRLRLPQGFRFVLSLTELGQRAGLLPTPQKAALSPVAKRQATKPAKWMIRDYDTTVAARDVVIDSRGGPLRVRLYRPEGWSPGGPGLLYIHGGGFTMGGLDGADNICRQIAKRTHAVLASVEYRLAPEDKFPAALEDCEDALHWFVDEKPDGIDPERVGVGGDSAGGNLSASLCVAVRDAGGPKIRHQTLIYPLVDATYSMASWIECACGGVDLKAAEMMMGFYAGDRRNDPLVGPLAVADLGNLPPAHVVTADFDVLRDEGIRYAERLTEAGVKTVHTHYVGTAHGFLSLPRLFKPSERAFDEIAAEIAAALAA